MPQTQSELPDIETGVQIVLIDQSNIDWLTAVAHQLTELLASLANAIVKLFDMILAIAS